MKTNIAQTEGMDLSISRKNCFTNDLTSNPIYRAASIYAKSYGLPVFPSKKDKVPHIQDWYHQASRDPQVIAKWFQQWPDANISMPTGSKSHLIVLDVDVKNGAPGFESLRELEIEFGGLPQTPTSISPSGGQHLFFKYDGPPLGRRIKFRPGLDLMAEDSHVLLPPSVGTNGKKYTWELSSRIDEVSFAPLPDWVKEVASSSSNSGGTGGVKRDSSFWQTLASDGTSEGGRNNAITQLAGHLLRHHVDPCLAQELILIWNEARNTPPLPTEEVIKTITSIGKKEFKRRRGIHHD